jgi:hypothetical protein
MKYKLVSIILLCCLLAGCSTVGKSVGLGTILGGAAGTAIGHDFGKGDSSKRTTGTLIGAAIGGLFGYIAHKNQPDKKQTSKFLDEEVPLLTRPKVRKVWVKDEVKGKRFVRGHWEYILEENSEWTR